ncbi:MAG: MarR family winged helix-turn-helix transcriptional regulator [Alphaproteobacteria bacterium]
MPVVPFISELTPNDPAALDNHVFYWITNVQSRRDRQLTEELAKFGLRVQDWRALAMMHYRKRSSLTELADAANFDQATLSRTIHRMVRNKLIARLSDAADMRVRRLVLTPEGESLIAKVLPVINELNRTALERLPAWGGPLLCWALKEMQAGLDENLKQRAERARAEPTRVGVARAGLAKTKKSE